MNGRNTITFVAKLNDTLQSFVNQCYELGVSEEFLIEGRTVSQLSFHPIPERSLIVLSSAVILPTVEPYLPKEATVIVANRTINYMNIRKMLALPKGMKVLLVSDRKDRAIETVTLLKDSGIDLQFYPYDPQGVYPEELQIAITPGEAMHVPPHIEKIIDIGSRVIDLSTWIEIYAHFKHESRELRKLTARYVQSIVYITKELSNEIQKASVLSKQLEAIVDRIEDAVLTIDEEDYIRNTNHKALDILHLQGRHILNQKAANCIPIQFYQIICQMSFDKEEVINWENQTFFFRKTHIQIEGNHFGYLVLFRRASEINTLEHEYRRKLLTKGLVAKYTFNHLTWASGSFNKIVDIAKKIARSNSTILLLGETGTGKELLAQAIHNESPRHYEPFVGVNFAAISETLLESELFGYEEGAFTGARRGGHIGLFEQAHKGTIFLDEIGDASGVIQNRLLRVLQEREIMKVGGNRIIPIDIRVIAATNRNLEEMVREGLFRADLYYRLNVLPILIPPLRDRKEDILLLAAHSIKKICHELKRQIFTLSRDTKQQMLDYHWPGNIRELENVIEYLAHIVEDVVYPEHLIFKGNGLSNKEADNNKTQRHLLETIYQSYVNKGFIQEIKSILHIMNEANYAVGRNFIVYRMQDNGSNITDQQLRYRLKMLKQDQLLDVGRGRQGSTLTKKGMEFLQMIQ
jgi:transcriptional regulator with PAS, ATPase and Fis domain